MVSRTAIRARLLLAALVVLAPAARATTVSYFLDQSNSEGAFPDGTPYLQVTIEESSADIKFTVELLAPLLSLSRPGSGIDSFGFNLADSVAALDPNANIVAPGNWSASVNEQLDGFGRFELVADTTGQYRQSPALVFYVVGISGDSPEDYVAYSSGGAGQGHRYFAAHVAGLSPQQPGDVTSAYFAGSTSVVPLPSAGWLLISAVAGFGAFARGAKAAR